MQINRMNKLDSNAGGKTRAFFDIQTEEGINIKGFRVVEGANGLFISPPNEKGKDGKYYDTVILPREIRQKLEKLVIDEYNR